MRVQWSRTICAILLKGIINNISMKSFLIWTSGSGDVIERYFLSTALVPVQ